MISLFHLTRYKQKHIIIIIIKNECHSNIIVDRLQGCGHRKKAAGKVKVSHATGKSFDRHGVSCKNVRTVQFSGGIYSLL